VLAKSYQALEQGLAVSSQEVLRELGLDETASDEELARAIVRSIAESARSAAQLRSPKDTEESLPSAPDSAAPASERRSWTMMAMPSGAIVRTLDDPRTLLAVLKGGQLAQRRAAVIRLGELMARGQEKQQIAETLNALRDPELAYELYQVRETLAASFRRAVRGEIELWHETLADLNRRIPQFWDGESQQEPLESLPGDQRALILLRLRGLSDVIAAHTAAVIEGVDGVSVLATRLSILGSLRYAGDPRLIPSLVRLMWGTHQMLAAEAVRCLGHIEDPRVKPCLLSAYEQIKADLPRVLIAGALGIGGDLRGRDYLRNVLERDQRPLQLAALEALASAGQSDDTEVVLPFLRADDHEVLLRAIRTLARIGDARCIPALSQARLDTSGLKAEAEDALASIHARLELLGEEPPSKSAALMAAKSATAAALSAQREPALARFRSWRDFVWGQWLSALGFTDRALAKFEAAAARRTDWSAPLVAMAMMYALKGRHAQALPAFRRALEVDRPRVESQVFVIRALVRAFLRRAEELDREGRPDIARALLEEVAGLDLRRASSSLRFELERRLQASM